MVFDAIAALEGADTCSVATAVELLSGMLALNLITAQSVRVWYEYNFAEERMKVRLQQCACPGDKSCFRRRVLVRVQVRVSGV